MEKSNRNPKKNSKTSVSVSKKRPSNNTAIKKRNKTPENSKMVLSNLPGTNGPRTVNAIGYLRKRPKKLTGRQIFTRAGVSLISVILMLAIASAIFWNYLFSDMDIDREKPNYPTDELTNPPPNIKEITNILLLGVDSRNPEITNGLSDTIIILTIDRKQNTVKLTSILRDCYTYIPDRDSPNKINAAYSFGGPELALRTVNRTFRLNIEKYVVVNMFGLISLIDMVGGIQMEVTQSEMWAINQIGDMKNHKVTSPGIQTLTGPQAVAYSRIRKLDSDWKRTERQQKVLIELFSVFKDISAVKKTQFIQKGLSYVKTNLTPAEITYLGIDVYPKMSNEIKQLQIPMEGTYRVNEVGSWHMVVDYNLVIPQLYDFIYGEQHPFDPVPTMSHRAVTATPAPAEPTWAEPTTVINPELTATPVPTIDPNLTPEPSGEVTPDPNLTPEPSGEVTPDPSGEVTPEPTLTLSVSPTSALVTPSPTPTPAPA